MKLLMLAIRLVINVELFSTSDAIAKLDETDGEGKVVPNPRLVAVDNNCENSAVVGLLKLSVSDSENLDEIDEVMTALIVLGVKADSKSELPMVDNSCDVVMNSLIVVKLELSIFDSMKFDEVIIPTLGDVTNT